MDGYIKASVDVIPRGINLGILFLIIEKEDSKDLPERIEFQIDIAFAADDFGFFG